MLISYRKIISYHIISYRKILISNLGRRYIPGGGGVLPYMGYIGMCGAKGYGFSAVLVINRVSLLAILPPFW